MRPVALFLLILVLAGCARAPQPEPSPPLPPPAAPDPAPATGTGSTASPPATSAPPATPPPPAPAPPATAVPPGPATTLADLIQPAPAGAVERVELTPGQPAGRPGIFFLQAETGAVTGWIPPGGIFPQLFGDRWILFREESRTLLADRTTNTILQWPAAKVSLNAAGGDHLLITALDRLWLFRPGAGPSAARSLDLTPRNPRALFSPDGSSALLLNDARLYHLETATGKVRELDPTAGSSAALQPVRRGQEALLTVRREEYDLWGRAALSFRRYGFDGRVLGEGVRPSEPWLSPDGKLAYWHDPLGSGSPSVTVGTADRFDRLLRVKGASGCTGSVPGEACWLGDGSGLLIQVREGYRILRTDGRLEEVPGLSGARSALPAPLRADRFLVNGTEVADAAGNRLSKLNPLAESGGVMNLLGGARWSLSGEEVIFTLGWSGKGNLFSPVPLLDPLVERGPFSAVTAFQVKVPPGDCLNLRATFGPEAPVLRCLPPGSRLIAARAPGRLNKGWIEYFGDLETTDWGGTWWLYARTEQGERGYLAFRPDLLAFAPGPIAPFPPSPLTVRIQDEAANLDRWLAVALGELPCGPSCSDSSLEGAVLGLLNRCQAGFAELKRPDGYDAAIHGPVLDQMTAACSLMTSALKSIGHPADTPPWRARLKEARSALR